MSTGPTRALLCGLLACAMAVIGGPAAANERPNFLIVIIDDIGFTDLGAYGSEMNTPNFDAEAERGAMFTRFHVAPTCVPSRAMLMTGVDSHLTGLPTLEHLMLPEHLGQPGHEGELNNRVATLAQHLQSAGYASFITGKWHLGRSPTSLPVARGFDRSFILDSSGADNWSHRTYLPHYTRAEWWDGFEYVEELPEDFYSAAFIVDRMISYLEESDPEQPFLSVVSFQANHIPVQAPREFVERYDGVYDAGWEALARERHAAAIARGLVPEGTPLPAMPDGLRAWSDLSPREQRMSAMSRQVAAGMLEAADHHYGRLVAWLRETGRYENTVIVIVSDNGPEFNAPGEHASFHLWLALQGYSRDIDRLGERGTYAWIGPEWASASSSPLSLFKFHAGEGGIRVPMIMAGPGIAPREPVSAFVNATDITPTLIDLAGAEPLSGFEPFTGRSIAPLLSGEADYVYGPQDAVGMEMSGQSALYRGDFKLTRNMPPHGDGRWRLFDVVNDPGETRDLSQERADLMAELMAEYRAYEARVGVLPVPDSYDGGGRLARMGWAGFFRDYGAWMVLGGLVLLAALAGLVAVIARLMRRA